MRVALKLAVIAALSLAGCVGGHSAGSRATRSDTAVLQVMNAAAITRPIRAALDSLAAATGLRYAQQPGATLEIARWISDLRRPADVLLLADPDVFPQLLMPREVTWYAVFARDRIVLAYTGRSRGAATITADNWRQLVTMPGYQVGRADPNTDPSGYRALLAMQLAERYYRDPGLASRLLAAAPAANVRPREADQIALLEANQLDYIWTYQSLAQSNRLRFIKLPDAIDLGAPAESLSYGAVSVRVLGQRPGDTLTMHGAPIQFALAIPAAAPHPGLAKRFVVFLLSPAGQRLLRANHVDALDRPLFAGTGVPPEVQIAAEPAPATRGRVRRWHPDASRGP